MQNNDIYRAFVNRLFVNHSTGVDGLLHASIGISGEAGELLDAIKKVWVYGKPLDRQNVIEELGDLFFYAQALMIVLDLTPDEITLANMAKLNARYPEGYTNSAAIARADKLVAEFNKDVA